MKEKEKVLSRAEVLELVFSEWTAASGIESVELRKAYGRVLAEDCFSEYSIPVFRASAMDGIAVRSELFAGAMPDTSCWKCGEDYVRADTGDDFDDRFDAVIKIEDTELFDNGIKLNPEIKVVPGTNVIACGTTVKKGAALAAKGTVLHGDDLAAIAMGGYSSVKVYKKPRVAFIPTGSELVSIGTELTRGKNFETNGLMAECMLREMGAEPTVYSIVPDNKEALREAFLKAVDTSDIVLINGGSSKGEEDFNTRLLAQEGRLLVHWSAAAPGRPIGIAVVNGKLAINIPGPSIGTFYCLDWCVRPLVSRMLSIPAPRREKITGKLMEELRCPPFFEFICRVEVKKGPDGYEIYPMAKGKANLPSMLSSNAMFVSELGDSFYEKGSKLTVELLRNNAFIPESDNC